MTAATDTGQTYLREGTISAPNKHLFSPAMQEAFEFFEQWGDKPFNPEKHADALRFAVRWSWQPKIAQMKKENPAFPFKDLVIAILDKLPAEWPDDDMIDLIQWAKTVWRKS